MRTRRSFLLAAGVGLLGRSRISVAQQKERVWRVGFLSPRRHLEPPDRDYYDEVPTGLRELGYVEGTTLQMEWRFADGRYERLPDLAAELVRLKVDVIVTDGGPSTLAAQKATGTIPIVFGSAGDPVALGLVKSLARPGGNTTGISLLSGDSLETKQVEMLLAMAPKASRIAVLHNPGNPYSLKVLERLQAVAQARTLQVLPVPARSPQELEGAFALMRQRQSGAFIWVADATLSQQVRRIAELASTNRLPSLGPGLRYPEAGGLMSYASNQFDNYRRAAAFVDKIFKGANPGDLPVEQPTKLELVINRKMATALGLTIPPELLLLADRVIE